jgi:hypothetical protein
MAGSTNNVPEPGSVWHHLKTDSMYVVIGIATCSTNGDREDKERSVIYWSVDRKCWRYRELGEFLDGRFALIGKIADEDERPA